MSGALVVPRVDGQLGQAPADVRFPSASSLGISTSGSNGHSIASASRFTLLPKKWTSKEASIPALAAIAVSSLPDSRLGEQLPDRLEMASREKLLLGRRPARRCSRSPSVC